MRLRVCLRRHGQQSIIRIARSDQEVSETVRFIGVAAMVVEQLQHW